MVATDRAGTVDKTTFFKGRLNSSHVTQLFWVWGTNRRVEEYFPSLATTEAERTPYVLATSFLEISGGASCDILLLLRRLNQFFNPPLGCIRSRGRCWAAIQLSHRPEPSGRAVHGEVDGLDIEDNMADDLFCATLTGRRGGHTPFVQAGEETSDTGAEAIEPDPRCSWEGSRRVGADVGDENAESRKVDRPLRIPLVMRLERCTSVVVVVRWADELLCSGYKWVSRFEAPCICTWWAGERWMEQMSRLHSTVC